MLRSLARVGFLIAGLLTRPAVAWAGDCTVTFGFAGDAEVSGVVVEVDYAGGSAAVGGKGASASCFAGTAGVLATFNDVEAQGVLNAALIRVKPFGGPSLFACVVEGADVDASDFVVSTTDASDSEAQPIQPLPPVVVTGVECGEEQGDADGDGASTERLCDVVFTLESDARVSGLVFEAEYGATDADPKGAGEAVQCETLLAGALGAYNDEEETQGLIGAIVHVAGVEGRHDLAACTFRSAGDLNGDAIEVAVTDAVGPTGNELGEQPVVFVSAVECGPEGDGTESGTDGESGEECGGGYDVTFAIGGDAELGALQLAIDYSSAPGLFPGSGEAVECEGLAGGFALFNDQDETLTLLAGIVNVSGFDAPAEVVRCRFEAVGRAPVASDFTVEVEDASRPDGSDVSPSPAAYVASVTAAGGSGCGACGNGSVEAGEECDDGNQDDADACLSSCAAAACGDGAVQAGVEACDDGDGNDDESATACRTDCTLPVACGDTDTNGAVTASDAKRTLNEAVGLPSDCSLSLCDVNGTGSITATDARMILNKAVGQNVMLECSTAVVFSLAGDVEIGGLELFVDYADAGAVFDGEGDGVACVSLLDGGIVAFNNDAAARTLHVGIIAVPAVVGPSPLFACSVRPGEGGVSIDGIVVEVGDAIAPDFSPLDDPEISVTW